MSKLIETLQIFLKYGDKRWPTNCEHDVLYVDIEPRLVSEDDIKRLEALGFSIDEEGTGFYSYHFGSC